MKYQIKNGSSITLTDKDYLAEGGEGRIYVKNGLAYKVCFPGKYPNEKKLNELSILDKPYIIRPIDILYDNKQVVGYSMRYLEPQNNLSLCQILTKSFRERNNITNNTIVDLVKKLKEGFEFVHSHNTLIVDANEFNFMVDRTYSNVYFIDTNSYQTPNFPATAIMSSIRDYTNAGFTRLTDWFSFGVLTFYMFVGIHPFGGNHPAVTAKEPDLKFEQRIKKRLSVLNSLTKYPVNATYPLGNIPQSYLSWYKDLFENGNSSVPPDSFQTVIQAVNNIYKNVCIKYKEIAKLKGKFICYSKESILTEEEGFSFVSNSHITLPCHTIFLNSGIPYTYANNELKIGKESFIADQVCEDYYKSGENIYKIIKIGGRFASQKIADCSQYSTKLYKGCFNQNWFGNNIFSSFVGDGVVQNNIKELKGHKIIEAYQEYGVLVITSLFGKKSYISFVDLDSNNYEIETKETSSLLPITCCVKPNKLLVLKIEEDKLLLRLGKNQKIIADDSLVDVIGIFNYENSTYFLKNDGTVNLGVL
jgi:hypothetical protein